MRTETKQFEAKELEVLAAHSERVDQQLQRIQEALTFIQAKDSVETEALGIAQNVLKETHETFRSGFGVWGETLRKTCNTVCKEVEMAGVEGFAAVELALKAMASLMESVIREAREYVEAERESVQDAKTLATMTAGDEIARLRQQNAILLRMLETEKTKADKAKDELIQRISGLLGEFIWERDRSLREAVGVVRNGDEEAEGRIGAFAGRHEEIMDEMQSRGTTVGTNLQRKAGEGKRTRDGAYKVSYFFLISATVM